MSYWQYLQRGWKVAAAVASINGTTNTIYSLAISEYFKPDPTPWGLRLLRDLLKPSTWVAWGFNVANSFLFNWLLPPGPATIPTRTGLFLVSQALSIVGLVVGKLAFPK